MNAKFLKEAIDLDKKWGGLLEGLTDSQLRTATAKDLECQRLHNETGTWDCCEECKEREKKDD